MPQDEDVGEPIATMLAEVSSLQDKVRALLPQVMAARRAHAQANTASTRTALEAAQAMVSDLQDRIAATLNNLQKSAGVTDEMVEALLQERQQRRYDHHYLREELTAEKVASDALVEEMLPEALDQLLRCVDPEFLRQQPGTQHQLSQMKTGEPLSVVKGVRPESEMPPVHRFLQAIRVCQDFIEGNPYYDHFAGALLLPQMAALGSGLQKIEEVGGDRIGRVQNLWRLPSSQSDAAAFEVLVASACVAKGQRVEFLDTTGEKTPDLRTHDPFPMVIECKRKRVLSDYEIEEERTMREPFPKAR